MLAGLGPNEPDETAWCGSFMAAMAWLQALPRPKGPAAARAWLTLSTPIALTDAIVGFDVVILQRGTGPQPGPDVIKAPGHVGLFGGRERDRVLILGGNQSNAVTIARYPVAQVLGVRRLA